jgi:hypothetical protein
VSVCETDVCFARNSENVSPYDPVAIRRLKDRVDGGLYVSGNRTLARALLGGNLVDELNLFGRKVGTVATGSLP